MPRYTVYYAKSLPDLLSVPDAFKVSDYLNMGELEAESLEQLFRQLQDPEDPAFVGAVWRTLFTPRCHRVTLLRTNWGNAGFAILPVGNA